MPTPATSRFRASGTVSITVAADPSARHPLELAVDEADVEARVVRHENRIAREFGYGLLGATWLVMKTEGDLQARSRAQARACLFGVLAFIAMVSVWTPFLHPKITARWFTWPNMAYLAPVPIVTAGIAIALWRSLARGGEFVPFLAAMGLFGMCYLGLAISVFPYVVPWTITLWDAASSPGSQAFLLVGTLVILPIVFMYTGWSYYVFRGKVRAELGYH